MATVVIIGLVTAVVTLVWSAVQQTKTINRYEEELIKKAKKRKK